MRRIGVKRNSLVVAAAAMVVINAPDVRAATWANTGTDFNAGASWVGGTAPTASDGASFTGAVVTQPTLTASLTTTSLTFDATASGYILSSTGGSQLTLTNATAISSAITTGTNEIAANIVLGRAATSQTISQAGTGKLLISGDIAEANGAKSLSLGRLSAGCVFELTGNNSYTGGTIYSNSSMRLNVGSSTALGTGALIAGTNSDSIDNTSGGVLVLANALNLSSASGNGLIFANTSNLSFSGAGTLSGAGNNSNNQNITVNAGITSLGAIGESGGPKGLNKLGAGALILTGANTYTGTTSISAGTLLVNGSHASADAYTLSNTATLGGNGSITTANANITAGGTSKLSPGAASGMTGTLALSLGTGTFDVSGTVVASAGSLVFDLDTIAASDKIDLTSGSLSIGAGSMNFSDFAFAALPGLQNGVYTLIDTNSAIVGTLAAGGLSGNIGSGTGTLTISPDGQDLLLTVVGVPEPASIASIVLGSGLMLLPRRRRGV